MTIDSRILNLVDRWDLAREQGQSLTPEELCRECPELIPEVNRRIEALLSLSQNFSTGSHAEKPISDRSECRPQATSTPTLKMPPDARYQVRDFYKKGGLGEVYRGFDTELGREVALKRIQKHCADNPESVMRFVREAELTSYLDHPGIVPIHGLVRDVDGQPVYAMRFIDGSTFKQVIEKFYEGDKAPDRDPGKRSLAFRELLSRFMVVCNTVEFAHKRGIIHRDLKPANIMVGPDDETLVVDWGLAKLFRRANQKTNDANGMISDITTLEGQETQPGHGIGTPAYMSPEQSAGQWDQVGSASDIFSLGATLFDILGRGISDNEQEAGDGKAVPTRAGKVPLPLDAIRQKAMALKPEDRYPTAKALAQDVEHWLAGEPVTAYREPWIDRTNRWARRHRTLVVGIAALLVTALVALAIGYIVVHREQLRTEAARAAEAKRRQQARQAFDVVSFRVIEDWLGKQKELTTEHKAFLERILAFHEQFAADTGQDQAERNGLAALHLTIGNIQSLLGRTVEAEAAYRRGCEVWEHLVADFPTVTEYRQRLAHSYDNLGGLHYNLDRMPDAEAAFRKVLEVRRQLAADFPTYPEYRHDLGNIHNNLGALLHYTGRPGEGEHHYRAALAIRQQLATDSPTEVEHRQLLAQSYGNLGIILAETGKPHDAEVAIREALAVRKQLAADFPSDSYHRRDLAFCHNNLGKMLGDTGRPDDAEVEHCAALAIQKQLAAEFPSVPEHRRNLAVTFNNLGRLFRATGRLPDAEMSVRNALKLRMQLVADFPAMPEYHDQVARSQASLAITLIEVADVNPDRKLLNEALELLQNAAEHHQVALTTNPRSHVYRESWRNNRQNLSLLRLKLGQHVPASDAAAELIQAAIEPMKDFYDAASLLARCAAGRAGRQPPRIRTGQCRPTLRRPSDGSPSTGRSKWVQRHTTPKTGHASRFHSGSRRLSKSDQRIGKESETMIVSAIGERSVKWISDFWTHTCTAELAKDCTSIQQRQFGHAHSPSFAPE